ncbi:MAG: phosphate-starvation-inducible PsiE family protein [Aquiluna sp.]|nr:phosphate-starvation-inducible PsiE family protein [Aquiluna sp.]
MENELEIAKKSLVSPRLIEIMEEVFHVVLGIFLFGIAVAALIFSVIRVFTTSPFFPTGMIQSINDILFIIIILEILRTVIARYTDGVFQLQNFLIIGIIAAVRHILTVGAYMTLGSGKSREEFDRAVIELAISSGIVVALVLAIFLAKAADSLATKAVTQKS